jgi:hypothetical protein
VAEKLSARLPSSSMKKLADQIRGLRSHPRASLFSAIAIFLILLGAGLSTKFYLQLENRQPKLPNLIKHSDINHRPLETFTQSLKTLLPKDASSYPISRCAQLPPNWVVKENNKPGVKMTMSTWHGLDVANPRGSALWLDKTSVTCGEKVGIHASSYLSYYADKGPRTFEVLRIGWYGGSGARLIWKSKPINLKLQKFPIIKNVERMFETRWKTTVKFTVGNNWTPGFYLITSVSPQGNIESIAPLIVRAPLGSSKLLLVHSTLTWQAYNQFGGRSLYLGPGGSVVSRRLERSRIVSMDRPFEGSGANHIDRDGITLVQFLERENLSLDQISDVDLNQWPSISTHYNGVVFGGHAEYFTRRMFNTIAADRNQGINLAFLGANNAYWQTRLGASPIGINRHVIVYRRATEDPVTNNDQVTVEFQDSRINTPPNLLTGTTTHGVHVYGNLHAVDIPTWLNIPKDSSINGISGDTEIDATTNNAAEPSNIHILFTGQLQFRDPGPAAEEEKSSFRRVPIEETIWFTTPSGAAVFDAGLTTWACNLLPSCVTHAVDSATERTMQLVTTHILKLWQQKAVGNILH